MVGNDYNKGIEATRSCKDTCISSIYERNGIKYIALFKYQMRDDDSIFNFLGAIFGVSSREFHSWSENIVWW